MNGTAVSLAGAELSALPSGALWWPAERLLVVADLHLGRSERLARRGGALLPPYDSADTLARLDAEIAAARPAAVVALGDSFDDAEAGAALPEAARLSLARMMAGRHWVWIAGNHDPGPIEIGGTHRAEWRCGPLVFRHIARPGVEGEVSGHFHPKARVGGLARPCFVLDRARIILPAFGTYTGGLAADAPALAALVSPAACALLVGQPPIRLPLAAAGLRRGVRASPGRRGPAGGLG